MIRLYSTHDHEQAHPSLAGGSLPLALLRITVAAAVTVMVIMGIAIPLRCEQ
jgi:hypothetical protein